MVYTVTMNPRTSLVRPGQKHGTINNVMPASKRRCVDPTTKVNQPPHVNDSGINDPFGDFTGDELLELELVASQMENKSASTSKQNVPNHLYGFAAPPVPQKVGNISVTKVTSQKSENLSELVKELQEQCSDYEQEINNLQTVNNQKSGEAQLLRDKVNNVEKLLHEERQAKVATERTKKAEKTQKEKDLEKKVEQYRDQMEFKKAELQEAQNLIRNLELKNKSLVQDFTTSGTSLLKHSFDQDTGESSSQKRIKFVKPESPRVTKKLKSLKDITKQSSSDEGVPLEKTNPCASNLHLKRRVCLLEPCLSASGKRFTLCNSPNVVVLMHYCSAQRSYDRCFLDGYEALNAFLGSYSGQKAQQDKSDLKQGAHVSRLVKCLLHKFLKGKDSQPGLTSEILCSSLNVFHQILVGVAKLPTTLLQNHPDIVDALLHFLPSNDCDDVTKAALSVFSLLARSCPVDKLQIFIPAVPVITSSFMSYDIATKTIVLDAFCGLSPYCEIVKKLASSSGDEEHSFIQILCKSCSERNKSVSNIRMTYLSKVVEFFAVLIACHDSLLSQQGCFACIYGTFNIILFDIIENTVPDGISVSFIKKSICLLHSCTNVHPDGIPGLRRDHKHLLLLWKLRKFLDNQKEMFWNLELKRILDNEINILEKIG
ncbi:unnamed protein product [Clavelina lepadiformis]|uniref:ATR-interacting protein n=1 Tax=Clavelina lepadiformis TaxID=159417 RepID=A0ABP0H5P0_CLALP